MQTKEVMVSIPQAVGTIAIKELSDKQIVHICFNTASGRYYCNVSWSNLRDGTRYRVSIPQAVGTIAIAGLTKPVFMGLKNRFWKTSHRKRSKRAPI